MSHLQIGFYPYHLLKATLPFFQVTTPQKSRPTNHQLPNETTKTHLRGTRELALAALGEEHREEQLEILFAKALGDLAAKFDLGLLDVLLVEKHRGTNSFGFFCGGKVLFEPSPRLLRFGRGHCFVSMRDLLRQVLEYLCVVPGVPFLMFL